MGLNINEEKTKFMAMSSDSQRLIVDQNLDVEGYKFEIVRRFWHQGSIMSDTNDTSEEIRSRIIDNLSKIKFKLPFLLIPLLDIQFCLISRNRVNSSPDLLTVHCS